MWTDAVFKGARQKWWAFFIGARKAQMWTDALFTRQAQGIRGLLAF
jgi:hypothetical protein